MLTKIYRAGGAGAAQKDFGDGSRGQKFAGSREQAITMRISAADLRKVKKLAQRLGARDSDVIPFGLRIMLARLGHLCDQTVRGRALVPVIVDAGGDILRHFDLDFTRLEEHGEVRRQQRSGDPIRGSVTADCGRH